MPDTLKPPANNANLPHSLVQRAHEKQKALDQMFQYWILRPYEANNPSVRLSDALDLPAPK